MQCLSHFLLFDGIGEARHRLLCVQVSQIIQLMLPQLDILHALVPLRLRGVRKVHSVDKGEKEKR